MTGLALGLEDRGDVPGEGDRRVARRRAGRRGEHHRADDGGGGSDRSLRNFEQHVRSYGCTVTNATARNAGVSAGNSVRTRGEPVRTQQVADDIRHLLTRQRARPIRRHRDPDPFEQIAERQIVPVGHEPCARERRRHVGALEAGTMTVRAAAGQTAPPRSACAAVYTPPQTVRPRARSAQVFCPSCAACVRPAAQVIASTIPPVTIRPRAFVIAASTTTRPVPAVSLATRTRCIRPSSCRR